MVTTQSSGKNSEKKRGRVENLKPFKPGQSGNPGGKPRKPALSTALSDLADRVHPGDKQGRTYAQLAALAIFNRAIAGNVQAFSEIVDRLEGKPAQSVAVDHSGFVEIEPRDARAALADILDRRRVAKHKPEDYQPPAGTLGTPVQ